MRALLNGQYVSNIKLCIRNQSPLHFHKMPPVHSKPVGPKTRTSCKMSRAPSRRTSSHLVRSNWPSGPDRQERGYSAPLSSYCAFVFAASFSSSEGFSQLASPLFLTLKCQYSVRVLQGRAKGVETCKWYQYCYLRRYGTGRQRVPHPHCHCCRRASSRLPSTP